MEYKRLLIKSKKTHTLFSEFVAFLIMKAHYADSFLSKKNSLYRSYYWLKKKFRKKISNNRKEKRETGRKIAWICWFQGLDNAPQLVKKCYESICYWLKEYEIVVITKENYGDYVSFPDYIVKKWEEGIISDAQFSDILRLELLI